MLIYSPKHWLLTYGNKLLELGERRMVAFSFFLFPSLPAQSSGWIVASNVDKPLVTFLSVSAKNTGQATIIRVCVYHVFKTGAADLRSAINSNSLQFCSQWSDKQNWSLTRDPWHQFRCLVSSFHHAGVHLLSSLSVDFPACYYS